MRELDTLSPGMGELNLNKKHREEKKPNEFLIKTIQDADC